MGMLRFYGRILPGLFVGLNRVDGNRRVGENFKGKAHFGQPVDNLRKCLHGGGFGTECDL